MFLIDDLLLAPIRGLQFIAEKAQETANRELFSEDAVKEQLLLLQERHERGELDEQQYGDGEAELLSLLRDIRSTGEGAPAAPLTADSATFVVEANLPDDHRSA